MDVTRKLAAPTVSVPTYAEIFGISRNHAYRTVKAGKVASIRIGNKILIPTQQLREMLLLDKASAA